MSIDASNARVEGQGKIFLTCQNLLLRKIQQNFKEIFFDLALGIKIFNFPCWKFWHVPCLSKFSYNPSNYANYGISTIQSGS